MPKTAIIAFGRMNPPTGGHQKLIDSMKKLARRESATPIVLLSHSHDPKKNPLDYSKKFRYATSSFGPIIKKSNAKNLLDALVEIDKMGFDNIIAVAGSDRMGDYERILTTRNGKEFDFENYEVVSGGDRDPDSEGVGGASASKAREFAKNGNESKFKQITPKSLTAAEKRRLYQDVRKGMNIKEEKEIDFEINDSMFDISDEEIEFFLEAVDYYIEDDDQEELEEAPLSIAQRRKRGRQMKRQAKRMASRRKITAKKMASPEKLKVRASRAARNIVRKKVAGKAGEKYTELSPSQKVNIDKRLEKKKSLINRLARRTLPQIRKKEKERLKKARSSKREGYEMANRRMTLNERFDRFENSLENEERKITKALREKAKENNIPYTVINEVYERGLEDFGPNLAESFTPEQWAFSRVNSFVKGGFARDLDEDLWDEVDKFNTIMEKIGINEGVNVDTIRYERTHGKKPSGSGMWMFTNVRYSRDNGDEFIAKGAPTYSQAKKQAKDWAKKNGYNTVYVMEETNNEGFEPSNKKYMSEMVITDIEYTLTGNDLKDHEKKYAIKISRKNKNKPFSTEIKGSKKNIERFLSKEMDYDSETIKDIINNP